MVRPCLALYISFFMAKDTVLHDLMTGTTESLVIDWLSWRVRLYKVKTFASAYLISSSNIDVYVATLDNLSSLNLIYS